MALLSGRRMDEARRRRASTAAALAAGAALAGCALLGLRDDSPVVFSHATHVVDQGMDCSVCHKQGDGEVLPTMPKPGVCLLCHKELDAEKPQERRIHVLFENDVFRAARASLLDEEVIFDHEMHVARGQDCADCHTGIETSSAITSADAVTMESCIDCHAGVMPGESCNVCHELIDESWEPESHQHEWDKAHGRMARMGTTLESQRCSMCHSESTCVQCHMSEAPENHDNYWRLRGHAVPAAIDRQNCAACHREDYCNRCHMEALPLSHTGTFGTPRNSHCFQCHFPLQGQGCVTCHKSTPSHALANPLPPDHNAAMNCRLCHGAGVPLMHADDGSDCILCHR